MKIAPQFVDGIRQLITNARLTVARGVDLIQVHTNFEIGQRIVEEEQRGEDRAAYGKEIIATLAARLASEFGKGFSATNLAHMRGFYLLYRDRAPILQTTSGESALDRPRPFTLSWSHCVFLLGVKNHEERNFYEIEATN